MAKKDCFDCEYYCDNGWKLVCLNENNEDGILAVEKGKEQCELWEAVRGEGGLNEI